MTKSAVSRESNSALRRLASTASLAVALVLIAIKFWAWIAGAERAVRGIFPEGAK